MKSWGACLAIMPCPSPNREAPLWDQADALANVGGEAVVLRDTAEVFVAECPKLVASLRESLAKADAERFSAGVHRLKGAVGCLTTGPVFDTVLRLEQLAARQDFASAKPVVRQLEQELGGLCRELREFCRVNHEVAGR
ncbi:MAG TPA: Hpt domain-containing protein [Terriglobales bacterium]|nr:Hpt domain-containing protein [Terriglobales bacterium]